MTDDDRDNIGWPSGWVSLGDDSRLAVAVALSAAPASLVGLWASWTALQVGTSLADGSPWWIRILVGLGAFLVTLTVVLWILWLRAPRPYANFDTSELRVRRKTIAMADLTWARLIVGETKKKRSVSLLLGSSNRVHAVFLLRNAKEKAMSEGVARFVAETLRRSSVAMPESPHDPSGRFAKFNFPTNISKDEALTLVRDPPIFGQELPISPLR